ncbi:MAG: tetratricopeptide repeat protein [Clostridium sp.]|nr:tetratricopeptide repeat protein [Clostridium sp.]
MESKKTDNNPKSLKKVESLLRDHHIIRALDMAIEICVAKGLTSYIEELNRLRQNYKFMLQYALTGNDDPGREVLVADTIADLRGIISEIRMDIRTHQSSDTLSSLRRLDKVRNDNFEALLHQYDELSVKIKLGTEAGNRPEALIKYREDLQRRIFEKTIALGICDRKALSQVETACEDQNLPYELRALLVVALYLSFSNVFNRHKFNVLLNLLDKVEDKLRARVITSLFLIMLEWHDFIIADLRTYRRLEEWNESLLNYTLLRDVVKSYLRALDTSRVNERLKNDIMPGLQSMRPEILKSLKSQNPEDFNPEGNPEWEEMLRKSGLEKKMREFQEMQGDGADMMMLPLSQLKNAPFFNILCNWFLPFSPERSELGAFRELRNAGIDILFDDMLGMCHSDRYSMALALNNMPIQQRQLLFGQLEAQGDQLRTVMKDKMLKVASPQFKMELDRYMRDLYRFYSLYRNRKDFFNPFVGSSEFLKIPILREWLEEPEMLEFLSEFFFKRGYYSEAAKIFSIYEKTQKEINGYVWQKLGYCYQRLGEYEKALECYSKAEFFQAADSWMTHSQAYCHERLGHWAEAARLYRILVSENPSNKKMLERYAKSSFRSGNHQEALPLLYKYDYEHPSEIDDLIIIAELTSGKIDEANLRIEKYMLTGKEIEQAMADYYLFNMITSIERKLLSMALNNFKKAAKELTHSPSGEIADYDAVLRKLDSWGIALRYGETLTLLSEAADAN